MPLIADNLRNLFASMGVMALVIAGLVLGRDILIPLALATLIAFILSPIVRGLVNWRVPESAAVGFVLSSVLGLVVVMSVVLSAQLLSLAAGLPTYRQNFIDKVRNVKSLGSDDGVIRRASRAVETLGTAISQEFADGSASSPSGPLSSGVPRAPASEPTSRTSTDETGKGSPRPVSGDGEEQSAKSALSGLRTALEPLAKIALTLLFALFLLLQYQDLRDRIVRVAGTDNLSGTTAAISDAGARLSQLFLAQSMLNAAFGIVVGIALALIGVPNPILWGVVAAIMRFVPFVGSIVAAVPPLLLAAGVDPGWSMVIMTASLFVIGEPLMGHVVEPLVLGKSAGLSPFALVVSASFWTLIWGPIGLVLAAPLTLLLVVVGRYVSGLEFVSVLLGDEKALSPEQEFYGRILADDATAAIAQVGDAIEASSIVAASDAIVLPALRLAAADQRRGRLEEGRVDAIGALLHEVVVFVSDLDDAATGTDDGTLQTETRPRIHVLPARGRLDAAAAEVVGAALRAGSGFDVECTRSTSGLSALASLHSARHRSPLDAIVIELIEDALERYSSQRRRGFRQKAYD